MAAAAPQQQPQPQQQQQRQALAIDGAYLVVAKKFDDNRGYFEELFNTQSGYDGVSHPQVSLSGSKAGVLRGMHRSIYSKLVSVLRGEVVDVIVDLRPWSKTYLAKASAVLSDKNHTQIFIPAGCAHGFCSMTDDSEVLYLQGGCYSRADDVEVNVFDPDLKIEWPKPPGGQYIISDKDRQAPSLKEVEARLRQPLVPVSELKDAPGPAEFLVLGASGLFGSHVVKALAAQRRAFVSSSVRVNNLPELESLLDRVRPKYVICAAGIAGRPGIDWCETHQPETIMVNVVGQLNVADACARRGIHVTLFGTGSLYCYDEQHPMGSGRGFKEEDAPNFDGNFYVRMRTRLEELLRSFSNVLNLRVVFPITSDMHPRSIIPKLVSYRRIVSVPTAFTVMDDLFPLIPRMADKGLTGTFNFVNPGVTSNGAIMQMYRRIVDPSHTWEDVPPEQQTSVTAVKRPYSELDMSKLMAHFPDIAPIDKALGAVFDRIKAARQPQPK